MLQATNVSATMNHFMMTPLLMIGHTAEGRVTSGLGKTVGMLR